MQVRGTASKCSKEQNPFAMYSSTSPTTATDEDFEEMFGGASGEMPLDLSAIGPGDYRAFAIEPTHFYVPVADERIEAEGPR